VIAPPWLDRFANRDFMRRYFLEPIEAAEAPVGIYVLKTAPGSPLDLAMWTELASHPKVKLVKDSSGSAEYCQALVAIRRNRPDVLLLTGNEFDVISTIKAGYDGVLLGTAILNAGLIRNAILALQDGDDKMAADWQTRSNELLYDLFGRDIRLWMGGLKYALVHLGIFRTEFMHMAYTLNEAERASIRAALEREAAWIQPKP
jgi:dihydrodipicolinate synthase/N-acetylneuraminate lyase